MSTEQVMKEQLKAVQLKYQGLKNSGEPTFYSSVKSPIQFTNTIPHLKPHQTISLKNREEKENAMLQYILEKCNKHGNELLTDKQKRLLPLYIEAYHLNQRYIDPNGDAHIIYRLIQEASEQISYSQKPRMSV